MDDLISRQAAIDAMNAQHRYDEFYWEHKMESVPFNAVISILKNLPSAQPERWIPVTERLPKEGQVVLITNEKGNVKHGQYRGVYPSNKVNWWWWKKNTTEEVVAWMPLPEPWRGEEHETD